MEDILGKFVINVEQKQQLMTFDTMILKTLLLWHQKTHFLHSNVNEACTSFGLTISYKALHVLISYIYIKCPVYIPEMQTSISRAVTLSCSELVVQYK